MRRYALLGATAGALTLVVLWSLAYKTPIRQAVDTSPNALFGGVSLTLELATSPEARERGLAMRASIPAGYGMLFVFPKADLYGFWMRDVQVPLDIFWLDAQGQVVSMALEVATSTYPHVFYPREPALYVLETAAGFVRAHQVATGTSLELQNLPTVSK